MATITLRSAKGAKLTNDEVDANFAAINDETVANTLALPGKAATWHTHAQSEVTGLQAALANKADIGHTHDGLQVSLRRQSTGAAGVRLTTDEQEPSATNCFNLPDGCSARITGSWVARQIGGTAGTVGDTAAGDWAVTVKRASSAGSIAAVAAAVVGKENDAAAAAWTFAVAVDTAVGGLSLTGTAQADKTVNWVATVRSAQALG